MATASRSRWATTRPSLERGRDVRLHEGCHLVLWGGCSVCGDAEAMATLRGPPRARASYWASPGLTGWRVVAMFGAGFLIKGHFFAGQEWVLRAGKSTAAD